MMYLSNRAVAQLSEQVLWSSVTRLGDLLDFLKPLATINLPKSPTFLGNFCKGVKIYNFSSEIISWATFIDIWQFFPGHTTLVTRDRHRMCVQ